MNRLRTERHGVAGVAMNSQKSRRGPIVCVSNTAGGQLPSHCCKEFHFHGLPRSRRVATNVSRARARAVCTEKKLRLIARWNNYSRRSHFCGTDVTITSVITTLYAYCYCYPFCWSNRKMWLAPEMAVIFDQVDRPLPSVCINVSATPGSRLYRDVSSINNNA